MPEARADLVAIAAWYTQPGSAAAALGKLHRINAALAHLVEFPQSWPRLRNGINRMMTVAAHRIIYRFDEGDNVVRVLRIFGPGQE